MSQILQFKITLAYSDPPIWRSIQVKDSITFYEMHLCIQKLFGWDNDHMHEFDICDDKDEKGTKLSDVFSGRTGKRKMKYLYDFGDSWNHDILLEKKIKAIDATKQFPVCIGGEQNAPPEDSGGIDGFYDKLEQLRTKTDQEYQSYEELLEWMGEDYDPKNFDIEQINKELLL